MRGPSSNQPLTHLYFVRHAHSVYTPDEMSRPLSERGFRDACRLTAILKDEEIDIIFSSPYKRAIQTVEELAQTVNKPVFLLDELKERKLTEQPAKDFNLALSAVWENPDFSWPGGESNNTAQKRGTAAVLTLIEKHKGKGIVISTHGNLLTLILQHFDKQVGLDFWQELDMPDVYKVTMNGTVITEIRKMWISAHSEEEMADGIKK